MNRGTVWYAEIRIKHNRKPKLIKLSGNDVMKIYVYRHPNRLIIFAAYEINYFQRKSRDLLECNHYIYAIIIIKNRTKNFKNFDNF